MKEKLVSPCHNLFPRISKQTEDFLLEPFHNLLYSQLSRNDHLHKTEPLPNCTLRFGHKRSFKSIRLNRYEVTLLKDKPPDVHREDNELQI